MSHDENHHQRLEIYQTAANKVISIFNSINAGKPTTRSNGVKEWTVLASVILLIPHQDPWPITITTGVKSLPDKFRNHSNGRIVHDSHAEILALRCFNKFLLQEVCNPQSNILYKHCNGKFSLRNDIQVALMVTETPCGDASMGYIRDQAIDDRPWDEGDVNSGIVRGRNNFHRLGIVRTKPGRVDSIETLSKSCSDKLCLKQLTGINNCITSTVINPIYLDVLMIPQGKYKPNDIDRCFNTRFDILEARKFQVCSYRLVDYPYEKLATSDPSSLSLVYINGVTQVLLNGVKNGGYRKNKMPKPGNESIICNYRMYQDLNSITSQEWDYLKFKQCQTEREGIKRKGKDMLGNWLSTSEDNFMLD